MYKYQGQCGEAETYFTKSLEMKLRIYGSSDHPDIARAYNNLGDVNESQGQYDKAETYYTKSLEMSLRLYGNSDHPDNSSII